MEKETTQTEKERKEELMYEIHTKLKSRCKEYMHFPKPIELDLKSIGKKINLEYFTVDWFGCNDILNYQTDRIKMKTLSIEDLEYILDKVF